MDKKTKELQENFENLKNVTTELNVLSEDNASLKINLKEQENKITSLEEQKRIIEKAMTLVYIHCCSNIQNRKILFGAKSKKNMSIIY